MQQRWTNRHQTRGTRLEPYPAPSVEAPTAWPEGISPTGVRGPGSPTTPEAAGLDRNAAGPNMELEGVYIISVAARLLEMHPQTLRKYERLGLIQPVRTVGMLRLYSQDDLRKVMLIRHLMDNLGLNLAGVEFALKLVSNLSVFSRRLARATDDATVVENIREEIAQLCSSLSLPAPD